MPTMRLIPSLGELEDRCACFDLGFEIAPVKQFALQGGKEALAHSISKQSLTAFIEANSGLIATFAEGEQSAVAATVRMMNHGGGPALAVSLVQRL